MARLTYTISSFNAGEISPVLDARFNLDFYRQSSKKLLNFFARPQGHITRRPGSRFSGESKDFAGESKRTRLIEFIFGTGEALAIEVGEEYFRFYQDGEQIMDGASPLEIATPYQEDEIAETQFAQTGDLLYLTHRNHPPQRLSRTSLTPTFSLEEVPFQFGPTLDENETNITLQASGTTGTVTITASASKFNAQMVGGIWALSEPSGTLGAYDPWAPSTAYSSGDFVRNDGKVYVAINTATSGTIPPTHTRGVVSDGGVNWEFVNSGTGYIKFETFISDTEFSGTVQLRLPNTVTSTPTLFWNEGAWSLDQGFPRAITFYEGRAFYAGTTQQPETIWGSKTNQRFENFDTGTGLDDEALVFVAATNTIDTIRWLASSTVLIAGTQGGIFIVRPATLDQIITPSNVQIKKNTAYSASFLRPVLVNNLLLFVQRVRKSVFTSQYDFNLDSFVAEEISLRAEHLLQSGIVDISYAQEPDSIIWLVTEDGRLIGITLDQQQRIAAFHQHNTNRFDGDGGLIQDNIESVAVLPLEDRDEIWIVVGRFIDGKYRRYIEILERETEDYFVDSGVLLSGNFDEGALGGFDHLEGEEVQVLLSEATAATDNLAVSDNQVVTGGEINLPFDAKRVVVGLPYFSDMLSHKMIFEIEDGMNLSKPVRPNKVITKVFNTLGFAMGYNENNFKQVPFRSTNNLMDNPPPIRTEDIEVTVDGSWDINQQTIFVRQSQPLPLNLLSLSVISVGNSK